MDISYKIQVTMLAWWRNNLRCENDNRIAILIKFVYVSCAMMAKKFNLPNSVMNPLSFLIFVIVVAVAELAS